MSNAWSSHHWDSHDDRSRGGWSERSSVSWRGNWTPGDNNRSGRSWWDGSLWWDCGDGWEGRALPESTAVAALESPAVAAPESSAAPESTAVAVPGPVALVPQPAAVAVPGTQPIVADAVPPEPTAVAGFQEYPDLATAVEAGIVRVFGMDYFAAWVQSGEGYKQHNAALNFLRKQQENADDPCNSPTLHLDAYGWTAVAVIDHDAKGMAYKWKDETRTWSWHEMIAQMTEESRPKGGQRAPRQQLRRRGVFLCGAPKFV